MLKTSSHLIGSKSGFGGGCVRVIFDWGKGLEWGGLVSDACIVLKVTIWDQEIDFNIFLCVLIVVRSSLVYKLRTRLTGLVDS